MAAQIGFVGIYAGLRLLKVQLPPKSAMIGTAVLTLWAGFILMTDRATRPPAPYFTTINNRLTPNTYVQDGVCVTLPVTPEPCEHAFNDGGTKMIRITDAEGKTFDVYIAHRFSNQSEWGTIYLNGYPGTANSVRVRDQDGFRRLVLKGLGY